MVIKELAEFLRSLQAYCIGPWACRGNVEELEEKGLETPKPPFVR